MNLRVATWNMNHWLRASDLRIRAWDYLRRDLGADIALLQEARPQTDLSGLVVVPPEPRISESRPWGSVVASFNPEVELKELPLIPLGQPPASGSRELEDSHPGAVSAVVAVLPDGSELTAVSMYGLMVKSANGVGYATTAVHRILSDLTPVLDVARNRSRRLIVGGDLNCSTQWWAPDREAHKALFARIAAFGLVDCLELARPGRVPLGNCVCDKAGSCGHVRTYRHRNDPESRPWQTDYLFVSPNMADRMLSAQAWDGPEVWELSDHCPLVAEFDL